MKKVLYAAFLAASISMCSGQAFSQGAWKKDLLSYLQTSLAKPDGGYGWEDQYDSHLTPTFAVTGILYDIGELPKDKEKLIGFIRTHHPQRGPNKEAGPSGSNLRNLVYEQIRAILWLGGDVSDFKTEVQGWKTQAGILANYETHGYGGLFQEAMTPVCHSLTGIQMQERNSFLKYLETCRRSNGSFNNAPALTGGDGNILNTYWALYALQSLSAAPALVTQTTGWLKACQLKNGGFTHQPKPEIGVNDDVIYTWAAIKSLQILGAKPANISGAIGYLLSLRNADGGFGDRPGLHSTPVASYYAIDALKALNALPALENSVKRKPIREEIPDLTGYHAYTVQFQASGNGSPQEAVMLADSLKISLWGVKYPAPGWVSLAQKIAAEKKVPVTFFIANEPHDNKLIIPGMGSFNHVLDYIAPASAAVHFSDSASFGELRNTTLRQLKEAGGGLMLQVSNNEPLARILLDESVNNFGYLAISTVHFGQNFLFWLPYLAEYRYRLPLVTLQDAHGTESWWWADELGNHRTLFIAKEPTYDQMVDALKNNRIAGVRHDSITGFKTRMFGGTVASRKFLADHESSWKWWTAPEKLKRPQAAITVIGDKDIFEEARPESGLNVRVRTRWNSTREALKSSAVELDQLKIDGVPVKAELIIKKGRKDAIADAYYLYKWGSPGKGQHRIEAVVKDLKTNEYFTYSQPYNIN